MHIFNAIILAVLMMVFVCCPCMLATESSWRDSFNKGVDCTNRQSLEQAEAWFRKALQEMDKEKYTVEDRAECLSKLASVLSLQGKTEAAEMTYTKVLAILEQAYGKNNKKEVPTLFKLGAIYESEGNHQMAMKYYSQAISVNEKYYGPYSPEFAGLVGPEQVIPKSESNNGYSAGKNSSVSLQLLEKQADLKSSMDLEKRLKVKQDLMKGNDSSNDDLLSDFRNDIPEARNRNKAGRIAVSQGAKNTDQDKTDH